MRCLASVTLAVYSRHTCVESYHRVMRCLRVDANSSCSPRRTWCCAARGLEGLQAECAARLLQAHDQSCVNRLFFQALYTFVAMLPTDRNSALFNYAAVFEQFFYTLNGLGSLLLRLTATFFLSLVQLTR